MVQILHLHTGRYVQLEADGVVHAKADSNDGTHFYMDFNSDHGIKLRNVQAEDSYLTLYEDGESATITHSQDDQTASGSGDTLEPATTEVTPSIKHTSWEYDGTYLRVHHSGNHFCYLAFEEDGTLVEDPCSTTLDLSKATVMLV